MDKSRGSVLIVVLGILALMFTVGVLAVTISSSSLRSTENNLLGTQARFSADSSLEVCRASFKTITQKYNSLSSLFAYTTVSPTDLESFGFIASLLDDKLNSIPETLYLNMDHRMSVLNPLAYESTITFPVLATNHNTESYSATRVEALQHSLSISVENLSETVFTECDGTCEWLISSYGLGFVYVENIPQTLIVATEKVSLLLKVSVRKFANEDIFECAIYFDSAPRFSERNLIPFSYVSDINWPCFLRELN